jgi:hypothetical protein
VTPAIATGSPARPTVRFRRVRSDLARDDITRAVGPCPRRHHPHPDTRFGEARSYFLRHDGRDKCGWDLTCTAADGRVARVEVKGVSSSKPAVLLTANEYRSAVEDPGGCAAREREEAWRARPAC